MGDQSSFFSLSKALLPDEAEAYELASLAANLEVMPIDTHVVSTVWDPDTAPASLLPLLGNELSVDLWFDYWSESKKRAVIKASPELHDLKTSIEGYRRYLAIVDSRLVDWIAPPKNFVAGSILSEDERQTWLRGLPELRLYTGADPGDWDYGFYADVTFADVAFAMPDRGRRLAARKAKIFYPETGELKSLGPVDFDILSTGETVSTFERISIPAVFDEMAFWTDLSFADVHFLIPDDPVAAPIFTWQVDLVGRQTPGALLDALPFGLKAVDVAPTRVPLRRLMDFAVYADVSFADLTYAGDENSALGYYDAYKLARVGDKVGTPLVDAGSFADIDYIGWPTHTLHLLVDASAPTDSFSTYADISFADQTYTVDDDFKRFDEVLRATYVASGPSSDHVTISTETTRFLTLADGIPLNGSFHFGQRIPRARA